MSEIDVDKQLYIPNSTENVLFNVFKDTKVSFVLLLIFVVVIYIGIFMLTSSNGANMGNNGPGLIKYDDSSIRILIMGISYCCHIYQYCKSRYICHFQAKLRIYSTQRRTSVNADGAE